MVFLAKLVWGWITGGGVKALTDIITKYQDSQIESERQKYMWAKAQLDALTQVRLTTVAFWEMRLLAFVIGAVFTTHLVLIAIDTFTTGTRFEIEGWNVAAFPSPINEWEGAIILSFFGISSTAIAGLAVISGIRRLWK